MTSKRALVLGAIALAAVIAALVSRGDRPAARRAPADPPAGPAPPQPAPPPAARVDPARPQAAPVTRDASPPPRPPRVPEPTEGEIMDKLHQLGSSDPAESLRLAREGNRRFRRSPEAPERASLIVKALSSMGRHDEARAEALKMKRDYPDSDFTHDVHRHMFVNPPTHPSERGYGKKSELE